MNRFVEISRRSRSSFNVSIDGLSNFDFTLLILRSNFRSIRRLVLWFNFATAAVNGGVSLSRVSSSISSDVSFDVSFKSSPIFGGSVLLL